MDIITNKINQICDLRFTILLSDQDVIRLFQSNSTIYTRNYPRYTVKKTYSLRTIIKMCGNKIHPKFAKLIICDSDIYVTYNELKEICSIIMK